MIAPVHQLGPTFGSQGWNDPLTWQTSSGHNEIGIGGAAGDDGDGEDSGRLLHPDWQTRPRPRNDQESQTFFMDLPTSGRRAI